MLEFLFKYPPQAFAKGTIVLANPWPRWILALLIVIAAGTLAYFVWRAQRPLLDPVTRRRAMLVWLLQSALATLLLLLLWEPALSISALKPQQNVIAVVVDDSRSMATQDGRSTRLRAAQDFLEGGLLNELGKRFQVRLYRLGAGLHRIETPAELHAHEPATHLGDALRELSAEASAFPIGAALLLSDGADNQGGIDYETMAELRRRKLPLSTIGFGSEHLMRDVELDQLQMPTRALAHSRLEAQVTLRQNGFGGQRTLLSLRDGERVLASREITLKNAPRQSESIEFDAGAAGLRSVQATLGVVPGESNPDNNQLTSMMAVDGSRRRFLYVEGEPRWEYKFLRRAVEEDTSLQVVSMLRTTQNKVYRQGIDNPAELATGFPSQPEELFAYDGIILGSVESSFFTPRQQELIRQFVDRRGGGLLFLAGRAALSEGGYNTGPFQELLPVRLPVRKGTFRREMAEPELTPEGERSIVCRIQDDPNKSRESWRMLPYLANYQDVGSPKPGAVTLARMNAGGRKLPLLVTENYGRGRTAVLATAGSWRWQMQQPVEDMTHEMFWRQLLRWAAGATPGHVVITNTDTVLADKGNIQLRAEVRDLTYLTTSGAQVEARIIGPDGSLQTVALQPDGHTTGVYGADWSAASEGSYGVEMRASLGDRSLGQTTFSFRRENGRAENFRREQNRELLERLAAETGGCYYQPDHARALARDIAFSEAGISARENEDLWDMPAVFLAVIGLRAAEWLLRRKWGVL